MYNLINKIIIFTSYWTYIVYNSQYYTREWLSRNYRKKSMYKKYF